MTLKIFVNLTMTLKILINLIITLKMFINFISNIVYARKRNIIVSLYIVNVKLLLTSYVDILHEDLQQQGKRQFKNVVKNTSCLFLFFFFICTSIRISFGFLVTFNINQKKKKSILTAYAFKKERFSEYFMIKRKNVICHNYVVHVT